jgi:hypothetical protein
MATPQEPRRERRAGRRRFPKPSIRIVCRKGSLGLGPNLGVALRELSETGAQLIVNEALEKRQEIEIEFHRPAHGRPLKVLAEVVWVRPEPGETFAVGTRFRRRLEYGDFQILTDANPKPPPPKQ